ncbi:MAG: alpha/beta hydrolase [Pseudomonadota bacterium]
MALLADELGTRSDKGRRLSQRSLGDASQNARLALVFLPGFLEPAMIWHAMMQRLDPEGSMSLAIELPGHKEGDTEEDVARQLATGAWLDETATTIKRRFEGKPVMLVGHSTGGMLAIALARRYPELVERLVLIGALTCGSRDRQLAPVALLISNRIIGRLVFRALWRLWLATPWTFATGFRLGARRSLTLPAKSEMRAHLRACDAMAARACALWVIKSSVQGDLPHVTAPILSLIGQRDRIVPAHHQKVVSDLAPDVRAFVFDAGHHLYAELPREVEVALRAWRAGETRDTIASLPREIPA